MKNLNRNQLLKVNTLASLLFQVVSLVCGFILPKLIIDNFGSSINGLLSSITQFLGIIALCEMGMGAVVPASLYKPLAEHDNEEISKIVISSEKFYKKIAIGMLIYIGVLMCVYPLLVDSYSFLFVASLILIIASSTFAQYYFGITYSLLITADQKQYITYILNSSTIILNLVISYLLIELGCSIHIVKLLSAIIFIFRPIFYSFYVKRNYQLNKQVKYSIEPIKQKWNGVAQHIAYAVQEKSSVLILTFLSTLEYVSIFSIYYLVLEGLRGFVYSVTSSITSFMGNIIARGEIGALKSGFRIVEWLIHTVAVVFFTSAAIVIIPFMTVYTQSFTDADYIVPIFPYLLCAGVGCRCLQMPYNIVVQAAGHFKQTQNSAIIEPIINICVSVALVPFIGLSGVAIGMFASMMYRMLYLSIYLTNNIIYTSKYLLFKRIVIDIVLVFLIVLATIPVYMRSISYVSWFLFGLKVFFIAVVITVIVNACCYRLEMLMCIKKIFRTRAL